MINVLTPKDIFMYYWLVLIKKRKYVKLFSKFVNSQKPFVLLMVGVNGAGKTTIIRMIMSIFFADKGRVTVLDGQQALAVKDRLGNVERIVTDSGFQLTHEFEKLDKEAIQ